jgi:G3E family GTPase
MKSGVPRHIGVMVITGYLGSGKTTLLRGLLAHPELRDTAVIVNEFGDVGLDHLLVEQGNEEVVLLESGCLCCTMNDSLADTLADLQFRRARGEIPAFRRVVVETSGLADPAPILHCLLTDRLVTQHYRLEGLITVVDAVHGREQLAASPEAVKQAATAERLVITKTDVTGPPTALRAQLEALNPQATITLSINGVVGDPESLLEAVATSRLTMNRGGLAQEKGAHSAQELPGHGAHGGVASYSFELDRPVTWAGYDFWVRRLRAFSGADLLRVKGVLAFEGREAPYFVQGVQHVFSPPEPLSAWPWPDRRGRLVFIARDIARATLERSLESLYEPSGIPRPILAEDAL